MKAGTLLDSLGVSFPSKQLKALPLASHTDWLGAPEVFSRFLWAKRSNHIPALKNRKMFYQKGKTLKQTALTTPEAGGGRALRWAASPRPDYLPASWDSTHTKDDANTPMTSASSEL